MASTYTAIATTTLGSAVASYTFSSIPSTYTDLVLVANWAQDSGTQRECAVRVGNGSVDTGSNYSLTELYGNGSSAASYRRSNVYYLDIAINTTVGAQNMNIVHFMNYSNNTTYKTVLSRHSSAAQEAEALVGLWRSTAIINTIQLIFEGAVNFSAGSTFTLYGIKAA
jgi:hypothetical protein